MGAGTFSLWMKIFGENLSGFGTVFAINLVDVNVDVGENNQNEKDQTMKSKQNLQGFTLVEIMIVVAIIGILAAIAIPNFVESRKRSQKNACIANLKQIQGAVEQAKLAGIQSPSNTDISPTYIKVIPTCPTDKSAYTLPTGDGNPTCGNAATLEHELPDTTTP